jgi:hypothetical protein
MLVGWKDELKAALKAFLWVEKMEEKMVDQWVE